MPGAYRAQAARPPGPSQGRAGPYKGAGPALPLDAGKHPSTTISTPR